MSTTPFDSPLYRDLFTDRETATLFTDTAELRAMLLTWGALALAQAKHGLIPETAAHAIQRAAMEIQIDPAALSAETAQNGVPVPALLAAFRNEMKAPEHSAYIHFGATSQDIVDTGLSLRLKQVLAQVEARLGVILGHLATLAHDHAETPIAGRTWGQIAVPTSFGAIAANWGAPLLELAGDLRGLPEKTLLVSLSGAAGTLSAMGPEGPQVRAGLAAGLGLHDPGRSWHSTRDARARLMGWLTQITAQLGKMGEDIATLSSSAQGEVSIGAVGASSTMPHKQNPVQAALLVTLARHTIGLNATLQGAALHRDQRDGAAWMTEWLTLPQICCAAGRALSVAADISGQVQPDPARMQANIDATGGLIYAEALTFHLAQTMPRPEAQALVKQLCASATTANAPLTEIAAQHLTGTNATAIFTPNLGTAPIEARAFATAVSKRNAS